MPSSDLAGVGELPGVHQLDATILGKGLGGVGGDGGGFLLLVGLAVGVDLSLVAAQGELTAEVGHLLVVADGFGGLVLLAVDGAEAVEEEVAVGFFGVAVFAVGVVGGGEELLEDVEGLVVAAERIVDEGFVIGELG